MNYTVENAEQARELSDDYQRQQFALYMEAALKEIKATALQGSYYTTLYEYNMPESFTKHGDLRTVESGLSYYEKALSNYAILFVPELLKLGFNVDMNLNHSNVPESLHVNWSRDS